MASFTVTGPDGKPHTIEGPAGATQAQAQAEAERQWGKPPAPPASTGSVVGDVARGAARGVAGDVLGAGQLASGILPSAITDPIAQSRAGQAFKGFATAPSASRSESIGRFAGAAAPFVAMPEMLANPYADAALGGAIAGGLQPTQSGSLASHGIGALAGGATGGAAGAIGGTPAQQAMRALGVRITPGRMVPYVGREWEKLAARLPILDRMIAHGRTISGDDFEHMLYRDALEPLGQGMAPPTATGSAGLDQLRTTVTARLNGILAQSSLPRARLPGFYNDLANIQADAVKDLDADKLRRLGAIMRDEVGAKITNSGGNLTGEQLAGKSGIIARLNQRSRDLWRSENTQDKALAGVLDRVEDALLDNADIGAGGQAALGKARDAYSRYKTLMRAGSGVKAEGHVDPESLLAELRRANQDAFTRGRMRLQPRALAARKAGVPTVGERTPQVSPFEMGAVGLGGVGLERLLGPKAALAGAPAALYNRPGMSAANWLAGQGGRLAPVAGTAGGQAVDLVLPPVTITAQPPTRRGNTP